jgi:hypothetical protein
VRGWLAAVALAALCARAEAAPGLSPPTQAPQTELADYDPTSTAWNGMASFVALAEGMGFEVSPVSTLEWSDLTDDDVLVLVYPLQRVDPSRLSLFVQAGGNVLLADDFGESREAMSALGLLRADVTTPRGTRFQDNHLWAPIASVRAPDHPIAVGVDDVVTNHPAALTHVEGATEVIGFEGGGGAVVVAGERGTGRFVAMADPSILINRMQQFPGNVAVATNTLRWLARDGHARHVVLLRGDVPMFGDPRPYIADPHAGAVGKNIADMNDWLSERRAWLLTPPAMRTLAALLAIGLLALAVLALPVRRGRRIDGAWLRFGRPPRRDDAHALVAAAEAGGNGSMLVLASVLRDHAQRCLETAIGKPEPLYTLPEGELVTLVMRACGAEAGTAMSRVYRRLRALPSRSQAAAPWSSGQLTRRDFDALYRDVGELCRTLGHPLTEASEASFLEVA